MYLDWKGIAIDLRAVGPFLALGIIIMYLVMTRRKK